MKYHALDQRLAEKDLHWPLCGQAGDTPIADDEADVDCQKCLSKLGRAAGRRWCTAAELALIEAVGAWHKDYANDWAHDDREEQLAAAHDVYEADLARRRHY